MGASSGRSAKSTVSASTGVGAFGLQRRRTLTPGLPPQRVALLELVAAQAAIALEHARLYAELAQENRER